MLHIIILFSWTGLTHGLANFSSYLNTSSTISAKPTSTQLDPIQTDTDSSWQTSAHGDVSITPSSSRYLTGYAQGEDVFHTPSYNLSDVPPSTNLDKIGTATTQSKVYENVSTTTNQSHMTKSLTSDGTHNSTMETTYNAWLSTRLANGTVTRPITKSSMHSKNASSSTFDLWSMCTKISYEKDFLVALRSLPPECDRGPTIDDTRLDSWGNYDYIDRCLARWCSISYSRAVDAYAGPMTAFTTVFIPMMNVTLSSTYKSTLAADENSINHSLGFGDLWTFTTSCTYKNASRTQ